MVRRRPRSNVSAPGQSSMPLNARADDVGPPAGDAGTDHPSSFAGNSAQVRQ